MKLHILDQVEITFTRRGEKASLRAACNPLTGDWLQTHTLGDASTSYLSNKSHTEHLIDLLTRKNPKAVVKVTRHAKYVAGIPIICQI